jgi:hypothetical protein
MLSAGAEDLHDEESSWAERIDVFTAAFPLPKASARVKDFRETRTLVADPKIAEFFYGGSTGRNSRMEGSKSHSPFGVTDRRRLLADVARNDGDVDYKR